ncbi:MAG: LamG domain-containing protein [Pseudobdellovibrio sp.]
MGYLANFILFFLLPCLLQAQIFIPFSNWKTISNVDKTFTLTNNGVTNVNNMQGSPFLNAAFTFKGGTYPDMPVIDYGVNTALQAYGFEILTGGYVRHTIQGTNCDSTGTITYGAHNLVVVTLTGTTGRIYINGALDSSCTFGSTPNTTAGNLYLGRNVDNTAFYTGELDDVGFWNVVLTTGELNTLYIRGKIINPP